MPSRRFILPALVVALLAAPIPSPAQSRPAAGSGPATTTTAPAKSLTKDLADFNLKKAALKPDDTPARLELARWAVQHELYTQAASLANDLLKDDPPDADARAAWGILLSVDQAVSLPTEPEHETRLKDEFNRRFHRAVEGGSSTYSFKTRNSRHFLIVYDTSDTFAASRGSSLEQAYDYFLLFFNMQKVRPEFLQKRLVVILFKNRDDYLAYAKSTEGADLSWAAGYYSQRTNRSAFYDDSSGPEAESVEKQTDKLRAMLKTLGTQVESANSKGDRETARKLSSERAHIAEVLAQINTRVGNALGVMNAVKTVHEAAHQLAFNTGIQKRLVDYPLWFSEGLACSFEMEDRSGRRGPAIVNFGRVAVCKEALKRTGNGGGLIPLEQFVGQPQPAVMDENTLSLYYAQGWALFHYLYKNNRAGLEKYLLAYQEQPALKSINNETRLKLFTDAFGTDLPALQSKLTTYIKSLPNKAP